MAHLSSPYWNERTGTCEKHHLPELPCPQCLATGDKDIEVRLEALERIKLVKPRLPDWLMARVA